MTEEESYAAEYAAHMADEEFQQIYEMALRIAMPGDDPLELVKDCVAVHSSLRAHCIAQHAPKTKHEVH